MRQDSKARKPSKEKTGAQSAKVKTNVSAASARSAKTPERSARAASAGSPPDARELQKKLTFRFANAWEQASAEDRQEAEAFAIDYMKFLDLGKTEREFVTVAIESLEELGFVALDTKDQLVPGDKVYLNVREKGLVAAVIGSNPADEGFAMVGAHIDSPRLDLKPVPLYEDNDLVYLKTHYYGGIKKYQWPSIPLALHGVAFRADGSPVNIRIGEDDTDPVFTITDILPHLGQEQMERKAPEIIRGEELNVLIGSEPYPDPGLTGRFKLTILNLLYEKYSLTERDLVTAELEIVPAGKARDVGLDRSLIGAYGQDDRVCAYTALAAISALELPVRTSVCMLFDKEEIGSEGNTGAQSRVWESALHELHVRLSGSQISDQLAFERLLAKSCLLSGDVAAGFDPTFPNVYEKLNSAYLGRGIAFVKYCGSRGKSGSNDASAEFFTRIVRILDEESIPWQSAELGKVDQGGGGTIAKYLANLGMDVIDCGVPLLSMHSPFEISSKMDVYYTYRAYLAFYENL